MRADVRICQSEAVSDMQAAILTTAPAQPRAN